MGQMEGTETGASAPPGWYPDPSGQIGWRWWTGDQWTEHVAPMVSPYPTVRESEQQMAAILQARQARLDGFISLAVWIWAAAGAVGLIINWVNVAYYRALWHWWHLAFHAIGNQEHLPPQPARPLWSSLFSLVSLCLLAIEVFFFIWQYRSATVARSSPIPRTAFARMGRGLLVRPRCEPVDALPGHSRLPSPGAPGPAASPLRLGGVSPHTPAFPGCARGPSWCTRRRRRARCRLPCRLCDCRPYWAPNRCRNCD